LLISGDLNRPFEISLFDEPAPPAIVSSEFINHSPSIRQNDALPQPVAHRVQESSGRIRFRFGTPVIDADTPFIRVIPSQLQPVTIISQIEVPEQPVVVPRITQPML
jgi:hypothetical protein